MKMLLTKNSLKGQKYLLTHKKNVDTTTYNRERERVNIYIDKTPVMFCVDVCVCVFC